MLERVHPPRLSRPDQIFPGFGIFFITCCTHGREDLLANAQIHACFRAFCQKAGNRAVSVGRYVIMPDHLHFFVHCGAELQLSDWTKSLKNSLSKALRQQGQPAPHWQKGFFDHLVRSVRSYEEKWQYTRENPVRAKLVLSLDEWPFIKERSCRCRSIDLQL